MIPELPVGSYTLTVSSPLKTKTKTRIELNVADIRVSDVHLDGRHQRDVNVVANTSS